MLTLQGDTVLTPVFGAPVRTTWSGDGSVAVDPPMSTYPAGTRMSLMALPNPGWYFQSWFDSPGVAALRPVTMTVPTHLYQAAFLPLPAQTTALILKVVGDGSIDASPRRPYYSLGSSVHLHAVAGPRAQFAGWVEDQNPSEHLSITMDKTKVWTARFVTTPSSRVLITPSGQPNAWRMEVVGWPGQRYQIYRRTVDTLTTPAPWQLVDTIANPLGTREWMIPPELRDPQAGFFQVVPIR